jgi:AraC-like DNA-binding protein
LERRELNVTEIAQQTGFSSGQYFAKVFQQHFGCTPNIYRTLDPRDRPPVPPLPLAGGP